jgi:hypothetical protein
MKSDVSVIHLESMARTAGSRLLILLLLIAGHAVLLILLAPADALTSERARLVRDSLLVAQTSLLVAWAVLGPGWAWLRIGASAVLMGGVLFVLEAVGEEWAVVRSALGVISTPMSIYSSGIAFGGWWIRLAILLAAGFIALRLCGWSVRVCDDDPQGPPAQFSIRTILIVTALVAVACWAGPQLRWSESSGAVGAEFAYWSLAAPLALAAIATHCAVLRPGAAVYRVALAAVWVIATGLVPTYLCNRQDDVWQILSWTAMSNAAVAVSLFSLRGASAFMLHRDEQIAAEWAENTTGPSIHPSLRATTAPGVTIVPMHPANWR